MVARLNWRDRQVKGVSPMTLQLRILLRFVVGLPIIALILFLPAGTLRFWEGWAFLGIWLLPMLIFFLYFCKHDPALVERRLLQKEGVKAQKFIIASGYPVFLVAFVVAGLDYRFGWTRGWTGAVPIWLEITAFSMVLASILMVFWVLNVNRYAARTVQVEAGQKVVSAGPYRWVRHPMYFGILIMMLFIPVALGSYVALPFFALILPVLVLRLMNEEKVLRQELLGYAEFCRGTRHRLIPYIW
jgi:protein-S-isoprenylcysteine O-methyltransferase Ste14